MNNEKIIPNPPKIKNNILFSLRGFIVTKIDAVIFTIWITISMLILFYIPVPNWALALIAILAIIILIILLIRFDGVYFRTYIFELIKYLFIRKAYVKKETRLVTQLGKRDPKESKFIIDDNNTYSKTIILKLSPTNTTLAHHIDMENRINSLNNMFSNYSNATIEMIFCDTEFDLKKNREQIQKLPKHPYCWCFHYLSSVFQ